jgi:ubiquinone biosynthesis protein COQ9
MSEASDWAEGVERALLDEALELAPRLGWSGQLVRQAGRDVGLTPAETDLLLPERARDLAALYSRRLDQEAAGALAGLDAASLKMRERIRSGVLAWLAAAMAHEVAARRWMGFLALPGNIPLGLRLAWARADALWRWAGDTATDENHYTKRTLLAEILLSILAVRLTMGQEEAERHLDGRIAAVMAFETWKADAGRPADLLREGAAWLGRLRYGRRPPGGDASTASGASSNETMDHLATDAP